MVRIIRMNGHQFLPPETKQREIVGAADRVFLIVLATRSRIEWYMKRGPAKCDADDYSKLWVPTPPVMCSSDVDRL